MEAAKQVLDALMGIVFGAIALICIAGAAVSGCVCLLCILPLMLLPED